VHRLAGRHADALYHALVPEPAATDFAPVAADLRARIEELPGALGRPRSPGEVAIYSDLVPRRAQPIAALACRALGRESVEGLAIADLGCGFGALALWFAVHGARVVGVDVASGRLAVGSALAAEHGLDVRFEHGSMERPPLEDGTQDVVVLNNSFCYVADPAARRRTLAAVRAALRPGGVVVLRNPNRLYPRDPFSGLPLVNLLPPELALSVSRRLGRPRSRVRLTTWRSGRRELERAGFAPVRHVRSPAAAGRAMPPALLRYQHFVASRPPDA
jgi:SAM-dependent methyltransferase